MKPKLANLGPKSEAMMRRAGIATERQLRALGAARAYVMVKRCNANASLNLLWALEAALSNRPWQEVAKTDRLSLLLQVEDLMSPGRMPARPSGRSEDGVPSSAAPK
jgi:DNA transformation protein